MVLSAVIWKHSPEDFGFTGWNRHGKSETTLKWHKDTIAKQYIYPSDPHLSGG
jgi:hypothetical protein